jgi:hypothetical protein
MKNIEDKIHTAILNKKLNLNLLGERNWYDYFIRTSILKWSPNMCETDTKKIEVYEEKYGKHLATIEV